ncbi:histidine kinase N-terminal 7TM domain-containing protein [Candidatus Amarolinea dominans]|uniref:histidine kinase N-terminal 7TM domain-containing protein n=1 Tax=Candidatus Amarolinea dominans TaxID=3140696 RepID=UPI001DFE8F9E|nr:hypothetical protein [Anaerolineae bacterium]MBK9231922.1 hypothetical protein [Anaerolineae bacterium]
MFDLDWTRIFAFANLILSSATVILAFALLIYVLTHNLLSDVGRSFAMLLACVTVVYAGDVAVGRVTSVAAAAPWLRLQWFGIAFIPAAYLHFSHALLSTTNWRSRRRFLTVVVSYGISAVLCALAVFTDFLVSDGIMQLPVTHLAPGPLFPVYVLFFAVTALFGARNVFEARRRCLTPAARHRLNYLSVAFAAPGIGVFPFLVLISAPTFISAPVILLLSTVGNLVIGFMLVVLTYTVAYFGVLAPDRVVRQSLIYYLLRGPILGTLIVMLMLAIPDTQQLWGLPREMVLVSTVVATIILLQVAIHLAKPLIDRLIYWRDRAEVAWLAEIDRHLLTSTDLRQVLENVLVALCETLRMPAGFVAALPPDEHPRLEAVVGPYDAAAAFLQSDEFAEAAAGGGAGGKGERDGQPAPASDLLICGGTWLFPLREQNGGDLVGWLGLAVDSTQPPRAGIAPEERFLVRALLRQAAKALEDRQVQQGLFAALRHIIPEIERMQAWRSTVQYTGAIPLPAMDDGSLVAQPDFERWVREALTHLWGGPKLTNSPLLKLQVVADLLTENDNNPSRALRSALKRAIELQRPGGDRKLTAAEWLLYNILEMRFVQGERVRDIAMRLALSESDLYRKQRVAITEVARTLADMEKEKLQQE